MPTKSGSSWPVWSTEKVPGEPGLHGESLSQERKAERLNTSLCVLGVDHTESERLILALVVPFEEQI